MRVVGALGKEPELLNFLAVRAGCFHSLPRFVVLKDVLQKFGEEVVESLARQMLVY